MKNRDKIYKKKYFGIAFPIKESLESGIFDQTTNTLGLAKSRIYNLLFTSPGERVMMPNFGVNITNRIFEPNVETNNEILKEEIRSQILNNVPDIKIDNIEVENDGESTLQISIWFSLLYDDNVNDSIVVTV